MDFKSDRISDFVVSFLSKKTGEYEEYKIIPLTKASTNITDCMQWLVFDAVVLPLLIPFCYWLL